MSDPETRRAEGDNQFAKGFLAALILIAGLGVLLKAAEWVGSYTRPMALAEQFVKALNTPLLSIFDILTILLILLFIYAFVWMAAFGPRPGTR